MNSTLAFGAAVWIGALIALLLWIEWRMSRPLTGRSLTPASKGIWGGTTTRERSDIRTSRRRAAVA